MTPVFYSSVTGAYDNPEKAILASIPEFKINTSIRFVFFTDVVTEPTTKRVGNIEWDIQPLRWNHPFDRRRTARWHKVNSHILFPDSTTIWADGSQVLTGDPADLLD